MAMRLMACVLALPAALASAQTAVSDPAPGSDDIAITRNDYQVTLPAGQAVTLDNPYGDVRVAFGGYEHQLEAHAVLQEPTGAAHIALEPSVASDGRYTVAPRLPAGAIVRDGQRLDLSVLLPEGHALLIRTEQGLIEVHGVHADVDLKSTAGDIGLRGIKGAIQAETGAGSIEASLASAPRKSRQRLATSTGEIQVGVDDRLDAEVTMATSAQFATDYSIQITRHPGVEPDKLARTVIGANAAKLLLESRRGEIRLRRRARFTPVGGESSATADEQEETEDNDSD